VVTEKRVLILADLDGAAAKLSRKVSYLWPLSHTFQRVPLLCLNQTYLRNQDLVTRLYTRGDALSILVHSTRSNSQYLGLVELLNRGLGEEDAGRCLGLGLDALDEDAVEERGDGAD
jgi:hypothetical protein